jgi:hypothetical protein
MKIHYTALPLDENEDFDTANFNEEQLADFYWDNPESLTDEMMGV